MLYRTILRSDKNQALLSLRLTIKVRVCHVKFVMKHYIMRVFRASTPFKEKSSNRFRDFHKLKLLTNFDVNLITSQGRVNNSKNRHTWYSRGLEFRSTSSNVLSWKLIFERSNRELQSGISFLRSSAD